MPTTRELHLQAMKLMDEALYVIKPAAQPEELPRENFLVEMRFRNALKFEAAAADSVSNRFELEPTRSVLHRGVASLALRVGETAIAKRYIASALRGNPPSESGRQLNEIHRQVLLRESLTRKSGKPSTFRTATGKTLVKETIDKYTANIPVNIGELLKELGLKLDIEPLDSARGMIERNLRKGGFSGYRVAVNVAYPEEDQRVASAHELSHFLKDRNRFTDRLVDNRMYSSGLANHVEEEADKIALDWLVPGKQLAKIRQEVGYNNAEALAQVFRIPIYEMRMRIGQIPRRHRWSEV